MKAERQIQVQHLGRNARRGAHAAHIDQLVGTQASLLRQLAHRADPVILAVFKFAGRRLEHHVPDGIPELPHHIAVPFTVDGKDRHAAGMLHDLALDDLAVDELCAIQADGDDHTLVLDLAVDPLFRAVQNDHPRLHNKNDLHNRIRIIS